MQHQTNDALSVRKNTMWQSAYVHMSVTQTCQNGRKLYFVVLRATSFSALALSHVTASELIIPLLNIGDDYTVS